MKKILLFLMVCCYTGMITAQDLIVKTNADEVQAKVVNVGEDEITYLKWDNQDGPTYTISVKNVLYIKYANGQKDVFTTAEQSKEVSRYDYSTNYLSRSGQTYIFDGHAMRHEEYYRFLQTQCPSACNVYRKGYVTSQTGWVLLGVGGALDILSIIVWGVSQDPSVAYASIAAGALEIASIPTLIVGYCKMHNSADIFNTECAKQQSKAYWSINADANGIGLALNF